MKKKLNKLLTTILIAISTILVSYVAYIKLNTIETSSTVAKIDAKEPSTFTMGSLNGSNFSEAYTARADTYCAGLHVALSRKIQQSANSPYVPDGGYKNGHQENVYTLARTTATPQTMAYAKWQGATGDAMQKIVWSSYQWKGYGANALIVEDHSYSLSSSSADIGGRAQQFANFVHIGLGDNNTLGMSCTPASDGEAEGSIKIVVNQSDMTYTVGPYMLNIAHQGAGLLEGGDNIANLVWREIINKNPGETAGNQFCWGTIDATVSFQNGSSKNSYIDVLDANGNQIQGNFPRFGEIFYIRYHTSDSEDIVEKIKPNIKIDYMTKITGTTYSYTSTKANYEINNDDAGVFRKAMSQIGFGDTSFLPNPTHVQRYNLVDRGGSQIGFDMGGRNSMNVADLDHFTAFELRVKTSLSLILKKDANEQWGKVGNVSTDFRFTPCAIYGGNFYPNATATVDVYETRRERIYEWEYVDKDGDHYWRDKPEAPAGSELTGEKRVKEENIYYRGRAWLGGTKVGETVEYKNNRDGALSRAREIIKERVHVGVRFYDITIHEDNTNMQPVLIIGAVNTAQKSESLTAGGKDINMFIAGNVWEDMPSMKLGEYTGHRDGNSISMSGMQVELWDNKTGRLVGTTMTDSNGKYGFQKINPMHKYYVIFMYDGMRYESTIYNNNLSGGYSTASESIYYSNNRNNFNDLFDTIDTSPHSYYKDGTWRKAYRTVH